MFNQVIAGKCYDLENSLKKTIQAFLINIISIFTQGLFIFQVNLNFFIN